jgi:hypothetical protein
MGYTAQRAEEIWESYTVFILWNCLISICAGILTILVMIRLQVYKNRMMAVVFVMTCLQFVYDFSLIPQLSGWCGPNGSNEYTKCRTIQLAITLFTGISSAQCTCLSVALIGWVILQRKAVPLNKYWMFILVIIPGLVMGIVYGLAYYDAGTHNSATEADDEIVSDQNWSSKVLAFYDSFRLVQIAFNTVCMLLILYELYSIKIICVKGASDVPPAASGDSSSSSNSANQKHAGYPMFLLASRLMWYPAAQTVSRIGPTWYHFATGDASSSYRKSVVLSNTPESMTIQLYAYGLTTPLAGLLYFFIFLMMQRGAWVETKMLLSCGWGCGCTSKAAAAAATGADAAATQSAPEMKAKRRSARIVSMRLKNARTVKSSGALFDIGTAYEDENEDEDKYDYEYGDGDREVDADGDGDGDGAGSELPSYDDGLPAAIRGSSSPPPPPRRRSLAVSRASLTNYKADRTSLFGQRAGKSNVDALLEAHKDDVTNDLVTYLDEDELCDLIHRQSIQERAATAADGARGRSVRVLAVQSNPVVGAKMDDMDSRL